MSKLLVRKLVNTVLIPQLILGRLDGLQKLFKGIEFGPVANIFGAFIVLTFVNR